MSDIKLDDVKPFMGVPITAAATWLIALWHNGKKTGANEQKISDQIASIAAGQQEIRQLVSENQKQTRESIQRVHEKMEKMDDKLNERIDRFIQKSA